MFEQINILVLVSYHRWHFIYFYYSNNFLEFQIKSELNSSPLGASDLKQLESILSE